MEVRELVCGYQPFPDETNYYFLTSKQISFFSSRV
jgi:hypothetical protein